MYKPLNVKSSAKQVNTTSLMAKKGMNLRDLPQLLDPSNALLIKNYLITAEGGLEKRKGLNEVFNASTGSAITMLEKWTDDVYLLGYDSTKLAAYTISTDTVTDIKTNFNTNVTSGARYGDYFFVASPQDNIGRVTFTLNYDGQTGNFATGLVVTGGTSGATAIILEDNDLGATGTLTLGSISGTFQNNEAITDSATGAAVASGTVGFTYTAISNAPQATYLLAKDNRLFAGNLRTDPTAVQYSEVDDGTNPPFTAWTNTTAATAGGKVYYRNAGDVNTLINLGDNIVVGCEEGKWAFVINTIDSGGTLTKVDQTVMYRLDAGMKCAIQTDEGIFYVNKEGLWQLVSLGQSDIKFSDQEALISEKLGDNYFENAVFDDADIVKDDKTNQLIVTYREDSATNNQCLVYNTQLKAFAVFTGWNINKFLNDEGTIYGAGVNDDKVWKVFDGNDDDGSDIWYEFEQELNVGSLWTRKALLGQYIQGELSPATSPTVKFSVYDRDGVLINDKLELQWNFDTEELTLTGYGDSGWGASWGGDTSEAGTVENFAGGKYKISNFQRIRVNISGHDQAPHTINWLSVLTKEKANIRKRNLTDVTA